MFALATLVSVRYFKILGSSGVKVYVSRPIDLISKLTMMLGAGTVFASLSISFIPYYVTLLLLVLNIPATAVTCENYLHKLPNSFKEEPIVQLLPEDKNNRKFVIDGKQRDELNFKLFRS